MTKSIIINIYFKAILAGSFASQLVLGAHQFFFEKFRIEEILSYIPDAIGMMVLSFFLLFIPFMITVIFNLEANRKNIAFNFKKHHKTQLITLILFGVIPTIKLLIEDFSFITIVSVFLCMLFLEYLIVWSSLEKYNTNKSKTNICQPFI